MARRLRDVWGTVWGESWVRTALRLCLLVLVCVGMGRPCLGAGPVAQDISRAEYLQQIGLMRAALDACGRDGSQCDPARESGKGVTAPDPALKSLLTTELEAGWTVINPDGSRFNTHWYWMAGALTDAGKAKPEERTALLRKAQARLAEEAVAAPVQQTVDASMAQARASAILQRPEFRRVEDESWWAVKMAALALLLNRLFSSAGDLLPHSPWVALAMEWGVFTLAAAGVLLWVWRLGRQQRLAVSPGRDDSAAVWRQRSEDWAQRAEAEAARGEWREAVHSLYWSAIVMLEGRKLWRENGARTPREYVALLEPGSARQGALDRLTRVFERIWYGLRGAAEADYQGARALLDELRTL